MKYIFPVVLKPEEPGYLVYVPDLDINTEGENIADAIEMARDAICLWGVSQLEEGRKIPEIKDFDAPHEKNEILTLVDVDFEEYKKKLDNRAMKKSVTLPYWLNQEAEKEGINFSRVLQEALKEKLGIS